jgi:uncharacterized repeat protein (TIGR01451 family)
MMVTNNGAPTMPATTSGVVVTDTLPAGVTFVSATPSVGTCSGTSTVTCNLGTFPSGAVATIDIVVHAPNVTGTITNTATVAAATSDPIPSNNTSSVNSTVSVLPTGAVSRKTHGSAGTFDIDLPLSGSVGVECRTGGSPTGNHTIVVSFPATITAVASATCAGNPATTSISGNQVTVNCTGVPNAQVVTIALNGVSDGTNVTNASVPMGVLLGDVNASHRVDAADVSSVRQQTLQTITSANFRNDINASGRIDAADVSTARQQTLTSIP